MPARRTPLPEPLASTPFSVETALREGVSRKRLRSTDLSSPFVGTRSHEPPVDVLALVQAYLPKMSRVEFFSHTTSAALHGMWLPFERRPVLHVSVRRPARAPRDRLIVGHHLIDRPGLVVVRSGLPITGRVETWCQLGTLLSPDDLVAAGDGLVAHGQPDPEGTLDRLRSASEDAARPCSARLKRAVVLIRPGVRSPRETKLRLLLTGAGLPEPGINTAIRSPSGGFLAEGDLVYVAERVLLEYEGDYHRTDRAKWRSDIVRYERLQDLGWRVIRVTADDLDVRPRETIARVRQALARR
ncbi:MAG: hypothetical protein QOC59_319 [Microbacteriaceae bacterium]|nr:hypothetical protein [Microbacteriaceae bacterium]